VKQRNLVMSRTKEKNRILKVYKLATGNEIRQGLLWYEVANYLASSIAEDLGVSPKTAIGVIAALSPNNQWSKNLIDARVLIEGFQNGLSQEDTKVSTYHAMKAKAWSILEDDLSCHSSILTRLNGRKIQSFYECISGFNGSCCIDGHARNIAYGERVPLTDKQTNVGVKEYSNLQESYYRAAQKVVIDGTTLKAHQMQAITWVAWRRIHGIK